MMVAGEASGDRHGAALALALRRLQPGDAIELFGSGGDEMRWAGVDTCVDSRELGIIGIPEIARALEKYYKAYKRLVSAAVERRADAVVLIDWPDFNLRLAKRLKRLGFKIVYYISPQVWAWRRYRVRAIRRTVERMLVILPFEEEFYRAEGVAAEYVGHPLSGAVRVTSSREEFTKLHGLDKGRPIVALLPGSRKKELYYHLPIMAQAATQLLESGLDWEPLLEEQQARKSSQTQAQTPGQGGGQPGGPDPARRERCAPAKQRVQPQFVLPLASTVVPSEAETLLGRATKHIRIIERDTYNSLGHSIAAVVASGTATVEAALLSTPMVIVYRGSELNWLLIRPLIKLDTFGMPNLIAGRRIVPELIQHEATPERIVGELVSILSDRSRLDRIKSDLAGVRNRLSFEGTSPSELAARRVLDVARSHAGSAS